MFDTKLGCPWCQLRLLYPWLAQQQITTLYIDPGCQWQNGKDERFNGTVRDECLNMDLFVSVREARVRLESFRRHYNEERPHSRLGYQTPSEFKQAWHNSIVAICWPIIDIQIPGRQLSIKEL